MGAFCQWRAATARRRALSESTAKQLRGQQAEDLACRYLLAQGLQLLERNYRCTRGEIDLIMKHRDSIVFVEVRYRNTQRYGGGIESVDRRKQAKLITCALRYLQRHHMSDSIPSRFDVIAVAPEREQDAVQWIRDAFQA